MCTQWPLSNAIWDKMISIHIIEETLHITYNDLRTRSMCVLKYVLDVCFGMNHMTTYYIIDGEWRTSCNSNETFIYSSHLSNTTHDAALEHKSKAIDEMFSTWIEKHKRIIGSAIHLNELLLTH